MGDEVSWNQLVSTSEERYWRCFVIIDICDELGIGLQARVDGLYVRCPDGEHEELEASIKYWGEDLHRVLKVLQEMGER